MNNNYAFFNPSSFRAPVANSFMNSAPLPRFSSLLGSKAAGVGAATSKVTFSGILNGASKTLGVINQAIPVFYQVKPIWNNARTMFRVAKEVKSDNNVSSNNIANNSSDNVKKEQSNSPTFFA